MRFCNVLTHLEVDGLWFFNSTNPLWMYVCMHMCTNSLKMHFFLVWRLIVSFWREKSCHYCTIEESEWTNLSKESRTNLSKKTSEHPFTGSIMLLVLSTNCQNQLSLEVNQNHFSLVDTNFHDRYQSQLFIVINIYICVDCYHL